MKAKRLKNGNILIPVSSTAKDVFSDGASEIGPSDPRFKVWDQWLKEEGD